MRQIKSTLLFLLVFCGPWGHLAKAQTLDTLVNVGDGYQLHFTITKGKGAPILFESGLGNGGDVWKNITPQIARATNATIITYDRLTYGSDMKIYLISPEKETKALETGLAKLGYAHQSIMLVGHSLGGVYCSLYAARHPQDVKAAVFIDDSNPCSLSARFKKAKPSMPDTIEQYLATLLRAVEKNPLPLQIPLTDMVADTHVDDEGRPDTMWLNCHRSFASQSPARRFLLAYNVGHYIFVENSTLAIQAIIMQYASFMAPKEKTAILEQSLALSIDMANETRKNEVKCGHSEDDLTTWGYSYLEKNETEKAIEVFKLNVLLNPEGWNTYDSLGEAYMKAGHKELAIKNYKKSLELNPKNDNAKAALLLLQK